MLEKKGGRRGCKVKVVELDLEQLQVIGSTRGRLGCGQKSRRKKNKSLNRDPGDIILEGCGPE